MCVLACVWEEAEKECSESVAPYMSSIIEVLTDNLSAGIQAMQRTLHTQMDSIFTQTHGETGEIKEVTDFCVHYVCASFFNYYFLQTLDLAM